MVVVISDVEVVSVELSVSPVEEELDDSEDSLPHLSPSLVHAGKESSFKGWQIPSAPHLKELPHCPSSCPSLLHSGMDLSLLAAQ